MGRGVSRCKVRPESGNALRRTGQARVRLQALRKDTTPDRQSLPATTAVGRGFMKCETMGAFSGGIIDLGVGQPDFPTPPEIKDAGKRAIDQNYTRYTPQPGFDARDGRASYYSPPCRNYLVSLGPERSYRSER